MRGIFKNNKGQAVVEYVLVMSVFVVVAVSGFSYLKCNLHGIWVKMACDILYPYPQHKAGNDLEEYCKEIDCPIIGD